MNASTAPGPGPNGSNFRQSELDKFAALANRWWDPKGPQTALPALNPVRLGYVADRHALRGAKVLDVGCGGALPSGAPARDGRDATPLHLAAVRVQVPTRPGPESGVQVDHLSPPGGTA